MKRSVLIAADIRFPLERANGVQVVKTAAALARGGQDVTLLVRQSDPRPTDEILALYGLTRDARLEILRLEVGHRAGAFHVPRARFLWSASAAAVGALRAGGIVFTRDLQFADLLLRLKRRSRLCYEAHALEALMYRERGLLYATGERASERKAHRIGAREARVWKGAAGLVTTTQGIRTSFTEQHGARPHVSVIPNGCDVPPDALFPGLARNPVPRVLYAGQLYPWKGVDVLVEALTHVPAAQLAILGGLPGENDTARIAALVAARGLTARVELLGTVPQARVAEELRRADVVAVPFLATSMTERHTSPLKAFEAMAAGRPIVISDLPSSREVLRDGENALLVPAGNATALGNALRRVLEDRPLAERLARLAFADSFQYSWDARARALRALFEELA
jgi:glycosyltransferase involved in cell wall biosynthesis